MHRSWLILAMLAAMLGSSSSNAPLSVRILLGLIGCALGLRSFLDATGSQRWWPLASTGVFVLTIAVLEMTTGLGRTARDALLWLLVVSAFAIPAPSVILVVRELVQARRKVKVLRHDALARIRALKTRNQPAECWRL